MNLSPGLHYCKTHPSTQSGDGDSQNRNSGVVLRRSAEEAGTGQTEESAGDHLDGTESRDAAGQLLGSERLAALASTVPVEVPDNTGEALLARVETFRSPSPPSDDETMIVLRRNGS